jgi:hypothetical protein
LFSGDFSYKSRKIEVMMWISNLQFLEMHDAGNR